MIAKNSFGAWALELKNEGHFIGFLGLHQTDSHLPPAVEIAWRLAKKYWHHGYATEAAKCVLRFAFDTIAIDTSISFTSLNNYRSRSVMERIGMSNTQNNFIHPQIPNEHPLAEHVLYCLNNTMATKKPAAI